ncbi:hypothetical protein MKX03_004089 [Papaver bracteatum]|nr:hypothetical protein MKX03_004089 [Papaver bracteatum]
MEGSLIKKMHGYCIVAFLLVFAQAQISGYSQELSSGKDEINIFSTTTVWVHNDLPGNLQIHCKSADDDLGPHDLPNGGYIHWQFSNNLFGTTLFWCSMAWEENSGSFEIYNGRVDDDICYHDCSWSVRREGIFRHNSDKNVYELVYNWP